MNLQASAEDAVFFDLLGCTVVCYPQSWALPLAMIPLAVLVLRFAGPLFTLSSLRAALLLAAIVLVALAASAALGAILARGLMAAWILPRSHVALGGLISTLYVPISVALVWLLGRRFLRSVPRDSAWSRLLGRLGDHGGGTCCGLARIQLLRARSGDRRRSGFAVAHRHSGTHGPHRCRVVGDVAAFGQPIAGRSWATSWLWCCARSSRSSCCHSCRFSHLAMRTKMGPVMSSLWLTCPATPGKLDVSLRVMYRRWLSWASPDAVLLR